MDCGRGHDIPGLVWVQGKHSPATPVGRTQIDNAVALLGPGGDPNVRMHVLLEQGDADDPAAVLRRCDEGLASGTGRMP